jgi:hypothetical protein
VERDRSVLQTTRPEESKAAEAERSGPAHHRQLKRLRYSRRETLADAKIEVWQADHFRHYDLDGYRYRASLSADPSGKYSFDSVMPGHYPARVC